MMPVTNTDTEHPLEKSMDVWYARDDHFQIFTTETRIKVSHGVVVGGGPEMVIIAWDQNRTLDRERRHTAATRYYRTRIEALEALHAKLERQVLIHQASVENAFRILHEAADLLATEGAKR
jgi:hypothetical protein